MAGYYGSGNSFSDKIAAEMKERAKKTAKKWLKRILIAIAPFIPAIFIVVMAGAGAMQIFSVFGGIADAIFGSNDVETRIAYEGDLNRLSLDEILTIVENDQTICLHIKDLRRYTAMRPACTDKYHMSLISCSPKPLQHCRVYFFPMCQNCSVYI